MRRWLPRLGLAVGLAVLGGAGLVAWPLVWPANPDARLREVAGRQVGEATGHVVSLDAEAGVLKISSSILGLRPVTLAVDATTPIRVRDKQGGLGDLAVDMPVRVAYELDGRTRRARSVELVVPGTDAGAAVPAAVFSAPANAAPSPTVVDPPPRVEPQPPARPAAAPQPPPLPPAPAAKAPVVTAPRKVVERAPVVAPARPPVEDEKAIERARIAPSTPAAPRPADDGAPADGSAAIDWLLRSRGR
jgi:hypothetical protein